MCKVAQKLFIGGLLLPTMKRLTQEEIVTVCEARGYKCPRLLPEKTKHGRALVEFKCDWNIQHTQLWDSIRADHGCGCEKVSYSENLIRQLLEWWTGDPCPRMTRREIFTLTGDKKEIPFEVDVYCKAHKLGIEVDGELHRKGWGGAADLASATIVRDKKKDAYFERNQDRLGILLRISTEELRAKSVPEVQALFSRKMEALDIPGPYTTEFKYQKRPTKKEARLKEIQALATSKGIRMLDNEYLNSTTKHTFECDEHGTLELTPNYLLQNEFGCRRCAKKSAAHKLRVRSGCLPIAEASNLAAQMKVLTYEAYVRMFRSGQLPKGLPGNPYVVYGKDPLWTGIKSFLRGQVI